MVKKILIILFIGLALVNCLRRPPRELTEEERELVSSNNQFGLKLFRELAKEESDKNFFISPLSVAMVLGMVYNGAAGSTQLAMQQTLELDDLTSEDVNASYKGLIELLPGLDPKADFRIANSLWYSKDYTFEKEFLDVCKRYFSAEARALDLGDPESKAPGPLSSTRTRQKMTILHYLMAPKNRVE